MADLGSTAQADHRRAPMRLRRLRLRGVSRDYIVDFRPAQDSGVMASIGDPVGHSRTRPDSMYEKGRGSAEPSEVRPVSIIAGEISTGKTTILDFIDYCLGARSHPSHPEVLRQVNAAQLELELSGVPHVIERSVGEASTSARIWAATLEALAAGTVGPGERRPIRPSGDPGSLSSLLLSHCGLEGVLLREAPSNPESKTDPLSFRDLMWLCYMRNERLDDKNLLFESGHMRALKLRQVVDVVFGVHDDRAIELGQRVDELEKVVAQARSNLAVTQAFVAEQVQAGRTELELRVQVAEENIAAINASLARLDRRARSATDFASDARRRHADAAARARRTAALLRDRDTLLRRLVPLRAQYSEDVRKLTLLAEAHALFDPLRVAVCPACLTELQNPPQMEDGHCTLCHTRLPAAGGSRALSAASNSAGTEGGGGSQEGGPSLPGTEVPADEPATLEVAAELRSTRTRLKELVAYVDSLDAALTELRQQLSNAEESERQAAQELDRLTTVVVNPFLAERDALTKRRQRLVRQAEDAEAGLRLIAGVERRAALVELHERNLRAVREQLASLSTLTDRQEVVSALSQRFANVLADFRYPKLERPYIADDLVPYVRGGRYTEASSGARTLISLAWILSLFEIAWERGASHPGFLLIDSPQKNLGSHADVSVVEFADVGIVQGVYSHIESWVNTRGSGAQVVIVDNSPPDVADRHVVVRFSRDPQQEPYGLIDDETG